jgi:hypothetical protein
LTIANITIQYPGGVARNVTSKNFSGHDKRQFLRQNLVSLRQYFDTVNDFPALAHLTPGNHVPTSTIQGTRTLARLHFAPRRNPRAAAPGVPAPTPGNVPVVKLLDDHRSKVRDAVRKALTWIDQSATLRFPQDRVDIFVAEENVYSLGYRWMETNGHVSGAAILLGKTASAWSGNALTKTVAQEVYEHYRPAKTVNALERRIMATLIHEMGHIFHQMDNLAHYITLARVSELQGNANPGASPKAADFTAPPTQADLQGFSAVTSSFANGASTYGGFSGLNEFVAEVFCALVMGAPLGADNNNWAAALMGANATQAQILAAYQACGGPMPEAQVTHVRT